MIKSGTGINPTKRWAKAKLINKKWGRFRSLLLKSIDMDRAFPTMIRKDYSPKNKLQ